MKHLLYQNLNMLKHKYLKLFLLFIFLFNLKIAAQHKYTEIETQFEKQLEYLHSLNINGGYVRFYKNKLPFGGYILKEKILKNDIILESPGTINVGVLYVTFYQATKNLKYKTYAEEVGDIIVKTQLDNGGWHFYGDTREVKDESGNLERKKFYSKTYNIGALDDNISQRAINFLFLIGSLFQNNKYINSANKGIEFIINSQFPNGAFPAWYPLYENKVTYSYNDGVMTNTLQCLYNAYLETNKDEIIKTIKKTENFILASQLSTGAWAEQYNEQIQPTHARLHEQPAATSYVTAQNIKNLYFLHAITKNKKNLVAIEKAKFWLKRVQLSNGLWARYYSLENNKPIYFNKKGESYNSYESLKSENELSQFVWESEFGIPEALNMKKAKLQIKNNIEKPKKTEKSQQKILGLENLAIQNITKIENEINEKNGYFTLTNFISDSKTILSYLSISQK